MHKKPAKRLAMDATLPGSGTVGVTRRQPKFPDVGKTISPYHYDVAAGKRTARPKHSGKRRSKKKIAFFVLLPFLLIGLWLGGKFVYNAAKIFNGNVFGVFSSTKLKGEDTGRVNILLAGNSADDVGHDGGTLTDSIMLVSIDVKNHSALMLSIPRDLYVDIPGFGHAKINEAYVDGEKSGFNEEGFGEGGMGLLQKTVQQTLGVDAPYYVLINYAAFRDAVDAVGGIDVTIDSDNKHGLYDPSKDWSTGGPLVDLSNGTHHLDGHAALNLARARGDASGSYGYGNSDFTRTENQRLMLLELKKKAFSTGVLTNPVKLSSLSDALGKNVKTNLSLSEVRRLYDLTKDISNDSIKSVGLNDINGQNYLASYRNSRGQATMIPAAGIDDFSDIKQAIRRLMSSNPLVKENANIVVLNATDTNGVASDNKDRIEARGMQVSNVSDAKLTQDISQIVDNSKGQKPQTLVALRGMYGQNVTTINPYSGRYPDADFIVIVGNDKTR